MSRVWNRHTLLLAAVTLAASLCAGATAPGVAQEEARPAGRDVPPRKVIRTQRLVLATLGERSVAGKVSDTRLALRKRRGGINGEEFPFTANLVDLGADQFGERVTTLTIDFSSSDAAAGICPILKD